MIIFYSSIRCFSETKANSFSYKMHKCNKQIQMKKKSIIILFYYYILYSSFWCTAFSPAVIPTDEPASQTQSAEEDHTQDERRKREAEGPPQFPVAAVIVYRTLGQLLPEHYDPDRRSLRYYINLSLNLIQLNFKKYF